MAITASPETDLAVAKACGIDVSFVHCFERGGILQRNDVPGYTVFRPTTDLNDAFLAAEKFGLFEGARREGSVLEIRRHDSHGAYWSIWHPRLIKTVGVEEAVHADTLPLAICAAILKLAEKP